MWREIVERQELSLTFARRKCKKELDRKLRGRYRREVSGASRRSAVTSNCCPSEVDVGGSVVSLSHQRNENAAHASHLSAAHSSLPAQRRSLKSLANSGVALVEGWFHIPVDERGRGYKIPGIRAWAPKRPTGRDICALCTKSGHGMLGWKGAQAPLSPTSSKRGLRTLPIL